MYPLLLEPSYKNYIWGGKRLKTEFYKDTDLSLVAESWECSVHPDGDSFVRNGKFSGAKLCDVIKQCPEILGRKYQGSELPILVKFIDAKENLSIQVHPDDEYALENENGSPGKFEMWYVLDANADTYICYGLNRNTERKDFKRIIKENKIENIVQRIKIKKDEVYLIEPGRIHSIGAGALIAEIQQNSNITYRLYDYNRKGAENRKLQIDKAIDVANLNKTMEPTQPMRVLRYTPGIAREMLCRCKYFEVHRLLINTEGGKKVEYSTDDLSFKVLLLLEGGCKVYFGNEKKESLSINKGDCLFVPANSKDICIQGNVQMLEIGC